MTSIAKLKDRARKFEQKEDWQAAINAYQQVLEKEKKQDEFEVELGLFNRIGDLYLRLGQTDEAVRYYETAADHYAEAEFFNNAIALCNKALRHRPDRPDIYLKLSGLCARQGFQTDARRWILEYADRQMQAGREEDAFTGLADFADLSDDPEIRETLALHLASHEHPDDALQQLQLAYDTRVQRGDEKGAAAVVEMARSVDPDVDLETSAVSAVGDLPTLDPWEQEDAGPADGEGVGPADGEDAGLAGLETGRAQVEDEPGGIGAVDGLETTPDGPVAADTADDTVGGLETFDAVGPPAEGEAVGAVDEAAPEEDTEELEEAPEDHQPLPLLETDYDRGAGEEAGAEPVSVEEPVPEEGAGFEEEKAEPAPGPEEPEPEEEPEPGEEPEPEFEEEPAFGEESEAPLSVALPDEVEPLEEPQHQAPSQEHEVMDLDLDSFDLGMGPVEERTESKPAAELDVEAVLQLGRELVSRGLRGEALRELRLLSGTDIDPATYEQALMVVNEILRHEPNNISAHERRIQYLEELGDRDRLLEAMTDSADAFARIGSDDEAEAMYERVRDLEADAEPVAEAERASEDDDDVVDLDQILREGASGRRTSKPVQVGDPEFAEMLSHFRAKVTEEGEDDEAGNHYDLGLAFKEMGLIEDAIAEFQTALKAGTDRLKVYEELGQCYMQQNQFAMAVQVLERALEISSAEERERIGVYYLLGQCHEALGQRDEARSAYEKVLAIHDSFADVRERVERL